MSASARPLSKPRLSKGRAPGTRSASPGRAITSLAPIPRQLRLDAAAVERDHFQPPGRNAAAATREAAARFAPRPRGCSPAGCRAKRPRQRPRRHEAHDGAADQCLGAHARAGLLGGLGLLGNGDAQPGLDQPREIAVGAVHRHAAHRNRLAIVPRRARSARCRARRRLSSRHRRTARKSRPCDRRAGRRPPAP